MRAVRRCGAAAEAALLELPTELRLPVDCAPGAPLAARASPCDRGFAEAATLGRPAPARMTGELGRRAAIMMGSIEAPGLLFLALVLRRRRRPPRALWRCPFIALYPCMASNPFAAQQRAGHAIACSLTGVVAPGRDEVTDAPRSLQTLERCLAWSGWRAEPNLEFGQRESVALSVDWGEAHGGALPDPAQGDNLRGGTHSCSAWAITP